MTKIEVLKKKIEGSYDKNQGCLEKKVFKLNKGMTKIKLSKEKIEKLNIRKYSKNQDYQEKIKPRYKKIKITEKKKLKIVIKIKVFKKN